MQDTLEYYDTKKDSPDDAARVAARVVEHIYYREQVGLARPPPSPPRRRPNLPFPHPLPAISRSPLPSPPRSTTSTRRSRTR